MTPLYFHGWPHWTRDIFLPACCSKVENAPPGWKAAAVGAWPSTSAPKYSDAAPAGAAGAAKARAGAATDRAAAARTARAAGRLGSTDRRDGRSRHNVWRGIGEDLSGRCRMRVAVKHDLRYRGGRQRLGGL